jgi:hypothetical protein
MRYAPTVGGDDMVRDMRIALQTEKRFGVFPCDKAEDILVLFLLLCGRFLCEYWHVLGKEDKM